jgi:hypothetical protein
MGLLGKTGGDVEVHVIHVVHGIVGIITVRVGNEYVNFRYRACICGVWGVFSQKKIKKIENFFKPLKKGENPLRFFSLCGIIKGLCHITWLIFDGKIL